MLSIGYGPENLNATTYYCATNKYGTGTTPYLPVGTGMVVSIVKYVEVVHIYARGQLARIFQWHVRRTITRNSSGGWLMVCLVIDRLLGSNLIRYKYQIRTKHDYYYTTYVSETCGIPECRDRSWVASKTRVHTQPSKGFAIPCCSGLLSHSSFPNKAHWSILPEFPRLKMTKRIHT